MSARFSPKALDARRAENDDRAIGQHGLGRQAAHGRCPRPLVIDPDAVLRRLAPLTPVLYRAVEAGIAESLDFFSTREQPVDPCLQRMATHQAGQKRVVTELLRHFAGEAKSDAEDAHDVFPLDVRGDLRVAESDLERLRLVVDFVSGMSDAYALRLYARITGGETRFLEYA
jgi:Phosphohydrolase-associated domain